MGHHESFMTRMIAFRYARTSHGENERGYRFGYVSVLIVFLIAGFQYQEGGDGGDQLGSRSDGAGTPEGAEGILLRKLRLYALPCQR